MALMVVGEIYIPYPPGSYAAHPDQQLFLNDILALALEDCGLQGHLEAVAAACRKRAIGHFDKEVERLERLRREAIAGE